MQISYSIVTPHIMHISIYDKHDMIFLLKYLNNIFKIKSISAAAIPARLVYNISV
jgi:hypothetical protein